MLKLEDIRYGGSNIKLSSANYATLNTNTPYIYLEKQDYDAFVAKLQAAAPDLDCTTLEDKYCTSQTKECDEFWPLMKNLEFKIDGTEYVISPEGYSESNSDLGYKCMIFVSHREDTSTIHLGNIFMQNFVTSYDYSEGKVKLGLNYHAPSGTAINGTDPEEEKGHSHAGLLIAVCVIVLAAIIGVILYCYNKRTKRAQASKAIAYNEIARSSSNEVEKRNFGNDLQDCRRS